MKDFAVIFSMIFLLNLVISRSSANVEQCTVEARCQASGSTTTQWMPFATPDDMARIEEEINILKKQNYEMETEIDSLKKEVDTLKLLMCHVMYNKKCFVPVMTRVNYEGAVAVCETFGGQLANIYSQRHMDFIMKYIRNYRMEDGGSVRFRLGMEYDPLDEKMALRDGTEAAADLKWREPYPLAGDPHTIWTNTLLYVKSNPDDIDQSLMNSPAAYNYYVLCEIE